MNAPVARKDRTRRRVVLVALLAFFLGIPLFTLLYVFSDLHTTMSRNAAKWVTEEGIPALKKGDQGDLLELSTVPFADILRETGLDAQFQGLGALKAADGVKVVRTTAQEQDDRGSQRATVTFNGQFENGEALVTLKVFKYSVEIVDDKMVGGKWMFDGITVVKK